MVKPKEDEPLRELVRQVLDSQQSTIVEFKRLAVTVYGDKEADILGLVGDNKKNKEYIENDKKLKWKIGGAVAALILLKDYVIRLFTQ